MVGLRGGTARQSRPRGSVLGSAASRCVGFNSLPHSLTAFFLVRTFSFRLSLLSSDAPVRLLFSLYFSSSSFRLLFFYFFFFCFSFVFFRFLFLFFFFFFVLSSTSLFASSLPTSISLVRLTDDSRASYPRVCRVCGFACVTQCAYNVTSREGKLSDDVELLGRSMNAARTIAPVRPPMWRQEW